MFDPSQRSDVLIRDATRSLVEKTICSSISRFIPPGINGATPNEPPTSQSQNPPVRLQRKKTTGAMKTKSSFLFWGEWTGHTHRGRAEFPPKSKSFASGLSHLLSLFQNPNSLCHSFLIPAPYAKFLLRLKSKTSIDTLCCLCSSYPSGLASCVLIHFLFFEIVYLIYDRTKWTGSGTIILVYAFCGHVE